MRAQGKSPDGGARSPLEVARSAIGSGRKVGAELEAFVEYGRTVTVKTFGRKVESVTVAKPRGIGVRSIRAGRTGYAFSSDLSGEGIRKVVQEAVENMRAADADPLARLPAAPADGYPALSGLWSRAVTETTLEQKIELALAAEKAALAVQYVETVEESVYADEEAWIGVVSTTGVEVECAQSFCWLYVMAHAGLEEERQSGLGFCAGREPGALDASRAGQEAGEKAAALLGARPCATGVYTVVFDREVMAALVSSVVRALSADAVQKGRSVFAGRLGETIGSPVLSIVDDGLAVGGMMSKPFDGEGIPQQATTLIDTGVLRSFLQNDYTARKAGGGARSTGNAARSSYRTLPGVGATNLVVRTGRGTLEDLVARIGQGLYVDSVAGFNSGVNSITGEISLGATGRMIESGTLGDPVREVTIATDFDGLLGGMVDMGGDARWVPLYGSVSTPSVAAQGITVSGR